MNKLKFKFGNGVFEFEVEGEDDFVKEKTEWAASLVSQSQSQLIQQREDRIERVIEPINGVELKQYSSIAQFLVEKKFASEVDLTLGIAYYLEVYESKESWNSADLKDEYSVAKKKLPSNLSRNLALNFEKSYIFNPNRDDRRTYCLTDEGKTYIENYVGSESVSQTKQKTKKVSTKPLEQEEVDKINEVKYSISDYDQGILSLLEHSKGQKDPTILASYLIYLRFGEDYEFTPRVLSSLVKKMGISLDNVQIIKIISANSKFYENDRRGWYKFNDVGVRFVKENLLDTEE